MFKDRLDAARQLSKALKKYEGQNPLILAIPRGAVPMSAWIADVLHGQMDVVLVRKLRAPLQPEVAIGAVDETGRAYLSPCAATLGIDPQYVKDEIKLQMGTLFEAAVTEAVKAKEEELEEQAKVDALREEIDSAQKIQLLKAIVKENPQFESISGNILPIFANIRNHDANISNRHICHWVLFNLQCPSVNIIRTCQHYLRL